jgi:RNA-directed DNA polymerase
MKVWPVHLYKEKGLEEQFDTSSIEDSYDQSLKVPANFPPLLSLKHLSKYTDVYYSFLRDVVNRSAFQYRDKREYPYQSFKIKKRTGGYREIYKPSESLMKVQRWIAQYILSEVDSHPSCFSYKKNTSIKDCASQHCGAKWLVKMDIQNFFDNIIESQVYQMFLEVGYSPLLSFELARLCTYVKQGELYEQDIGLIKKSATVYSIESYNNQLVGHTVQGAPTSPLISNLVLKDFDEVCYQYCLEEGLVYTRYCDDITISSNGQNFGREACLSVRDFIYGKLKEHNFFPNKQKFKIIPSGARKLVLGLLVDGDEPRLSKQFKLKMKKHIYYLKRNPVTHCKSMGFKSHFGFRNHIQGLIAYIKGVEPSFYEKIRDDYLSIDWVF